MTPRITLFSIAFLLIFTTGCSDQQNNTPTTTTEPEQHLLIQQQRALEKAQSVNDVIQGSAEQQKRKIEESTN